MRLGICLSSGGLQQLEPLLAVQALDGVIVPSHLADPDHPERLSHPDGPGGWLRQHWSDLQLLVGALASGALIRMLAPLLRDKHDDPAVLLLSADGRLVLPLLGSHLGGAEDEARRCAALLGLELVSSGDCARRGAPALDSIGDGWGWRRSGNDWNQLMQSAARGEPVALRASAGQDEALRQLIATAGLGDEAVAGAGSSRTVLQISLDSGEGCRWHPPQLWLGIGCERGTSLPLLEQAVDDALREAGLAVEAVAGLASLELKGDEPALLALSERRDWPVRLYPSERLAMVAVPNPSERVRQEVGTASVAEAAALAAAGAEAELLLQKRIVRGTPGSGAATVAIARAHRPWAPRRGSLALVGAGPGCLTQLTGAARGALAQAALWCGYGPYLDLLEPLRRGDQARLDGRLTEERQRCRQALARACEGVRVALVSSGESGLYGMAGLALEEWLQLPAAERPAFAVHPGISALQMAAARVGAPLMHDVCTISLSDRLTPWSVIERRLRAAALGDFVVALYNPRSRDRHWQLGQALELLQTGRPGSTPVALCRQLGRAEEQLLLTRLDTVDVGQVDMLTLVLVGNSTTRIIDGRMVTPRGYPGATLEGGTTPTEGEGGAAPREVKSG
jgi:cobalt-precorrin 5A hydrolase / precorrin-3B C17-methyltransferase